MATPDEIVAGATHELGGSFLRNVMRPPDAQRPRWRLTFADGTTTITRLDPTKVTWVQEVVMAERLPSIDKWID